MSSVVQLFVDISLLFVDSRWMLQFVVILVFEGTAVAREKHLSSNTDKLPDFGFKKDFYLFALEKQTAGTYARLTKTCL